MASTDQIMEAANALGEMVAEHEATKRMESAVSALESDVDAQRAVADLNRHIESLGKKQAEGQPIEVGDKRRLETLQKAVTRSAVLREVQVAQMDYLDLMRRIDDAITGSSAKLDTPDLVRGVE